MGRKPGRGARHHWGAARKAQVDLLGAVLVVAPFAGFTKIAHGGTHC